MNRVDLLVAGAGPTGLTAAIAAAQRGLSVVVVDPRTGTLDKACGEGLMPAARDALAALDVHPHGRPFHGIRYIDGDVVAEGHFARPALGVRRTRLHEALAARADALGVERRPARVDDVRQDDQVVEAAGVRAQWMIAADGLRSPTRRAVGLDRDPGRRPRFGIRRHFAVRPWSDTVDVHWAPDAEAYVTPVDDQLVGVAFLFGEPARAADQGQDGSTFDRMLARFPALADRLDAPANEVRGAGPFDAASRGRVAGRVLLAGDAAGYVDPLTGEGMKLGIQSALAAVDAIVDGAPQRYERDWRRLWRPYAMTTAGLLAVSRVPVLRRALPRVLRRAPPVFDAALRVLAA